MLLKRNWLRARFAGSEGRSLGRLATGRKFEGFCVPLHRNAHGVGC